MTMRPTPSSAHAAERALDAAAPPPAPQVPAAFRGRLRPAYPLYRAFQLWSDADGLRMSAAMSFYGMFSLAPLLLVLVALLGYVVDKQVVEANLLGQIQDIVGPQGAELIRAALASARQPGDGLFASAIAFILLVSGATGVFAELQSALERLWTQGTGTQAMDAWWHKATMRLRGIAYVLAFGFLMLVSLVIASAVNLLQSWAGARYQMDAIWVVLNQLLSFAITTALFVALMRMSAGPQPRLRYLAAGAAIGAVLFGVGKYALALYLSTAAVVSAYGAAGSLVVLLMWIYFTSAVLLLGASFARVMAEGHGDFNPAATPVPAAAVTAAQSQARRDADAPASAAPARALSSAANAPARTVRSAAAAATGAARAVASARPARPPVQADLSPAYIAAAAVTFAASYFLLRPGKAERARAAAAPAANPWRALAARQPAPAPSGGRDLGDDDFRYAPTRAPRSAAGPERTGARLGKLGLALLGSRAARQAARWAWQGTRAVRSDAAARLGARATGMGGAMQWVQRANAWRERHALAKARRELDQDLRQLRRAARRR
ncbi:YihY/virulence factor BrkB family protein [Ottowia oryzae]|uniref:YihY/virulence factor BrkB family protein n=1 Tax=Ottowia oryzae TaxID=2109914 RepID=UPI00269FEBE8